jgi:geranylgeranyl pyrophosphate synthase
MDPKIVSDFEKNIQHYFSSRWTKENIEFFLGLSKYEIDVYALQKSLNKPIRSFLLRGGKRLRPLLFWTILINT